eukprot:10407988-Alexandrium_andersonii.AAC.1
MNLNPACGKGTCTTDSEMNLPATCTTTTATPARARLRFSRPLVGLTPRQSPRGVVETKIGVQGLCWRLAGWRGS